MIDRGYVRSEMLAAHMAPATVEEIVRRLPERAPSAQMLRALDRAAAGIEIPETALTWSRPPADAAPAPTPAEPPAPPTLADIAATLDHAVDAHWTKDGHPSAVALTEIAGRRVSAIEARGLGLMRRQPPAD